MGIQIVVSFFAELKRRKVFRVAVVYAATAFVILQAADIMLPRLAVPEWALTLVVVLTVLGFPIALVLAWALELTPDGIKRAEAAPSEASGATTPALLGKRTVLVSALLVAIGIGLGAGWLLKPGGASLAEPLAGPAAPVAELLPDTSSPAIVERADISIAVLPFLNMSPDPANAFFADGISEELMSILVGVEGLKVASRTSAFSFKGKDTPIPEIARQLGVRHILEGSVRRQDNRVRIMVQLIEAGNDAHLWSERYDRDLDDIFQVQEEIAQAIMLALEDILGTRQVAVKAPTRDMEAYRRYLRGRSRFYQRSELDQAIDDLEFAVERDPEFANAWAFLGAARHVASSGWPTERDRGALRAQVPLAAERALALDPGLGIALAVKGDWLFREGDPAQMAQGLRLLEEAADQAAADTSARLWLGLSWLDLGFVERALPHLKNAHARDALVPINNGYLGLAFATQGRLQEGGRLALRAAELSAQAFWSCVIALELANAGDSAGAYEILAATQPMIEAGDSEFLTGMLAALDDPSRRAAFLAAHELDAQQGHLLARMAALMFRAPDMVFGTAGPRAAHDFMTSSTWLPSLGWVREDPRFYALMRERGVVAFWEMHGFPPGCRPVEDPAGSRLDCSEYAP